MISSQNKPETRCAIYTRKSTSEGLEQEFNSLDAQRESAEAYISSQRIEGWTCLPDYYDDGGFSGGNMERPALKRLMHDIETGKVDLVVVYKVDRLSRSLLDFSRLIQIFDKYKVSFVSVTQQFNTTHSMGRLTLNILLSFAQFEREIIAERTKDKMSAARRKGKWTGGMPMLGYDIDPKGGRLNINEQEAAQVKRIFELYLEKQSLIPTVRMLNQKSWATKRWITKKGKKRGGKPFDKNSLFRMLSNIIYLGRVKYQGEVYEGEHEGIIREELWQSAQKQMRQNGQNGGSQSRNKYGALLRGLLYCIPCNTTMNHTYTTSGQKRYRYYVCFKAQMQGWETCPSKSIPAVEIEQFVIERIRCIGRDPELIRETFNQACLENQEQLTQLEQDRHIGERDLKLMGSELRQLIGQAATDKAYNSPSTRLLADLQDKISTREQHLAQLNEEIIAINKIQVNRRDLSTALSFFDPIWETLSKREQRRIIQLLVERVGYDGDKGTVAITFRPSGIKALAHEAQTA
jgi:site-specific DNA recombinase